MPDPMTIVRLRVLSRTFRDLAKELAWSVDITIGRGPRVVTIDGPQRRHLEIRGNDLSGIRLACLGGRLERLGLMGGSLTYDVLRGVGTDNLMIAGCDEVCLLRQRLALTHLGRVHTVEWNYASSNVTHICSVIGGLDVTSLKLTSTVDVPNPFDCLAFAQLPHTLVHFELVGYEDEILDNNDAAGSMSLGLLQLPNLQSFKSNIFYCVSEEDARAVGRLLATHPSLETLTMLRDPNALLFQEAQRLVTSTSKLRQLRLHFFAPAIDDLRSMVSFLRGLPHLEHLGCHVDNSQSLVEGTTEANVVDTVQAELRDLFATLADRPCFTDLQLYIDEPFDVAEIADQATFLARGIHVDYESDAAWNDDFITRGSSTTTPAS